MHARRRRHAVLACSAPARIEALWPQLADLRPVAWIRRPETGLVMLSGRIGGTGEPFNLGEATLTRCTVRWDSPSGPIVGSGHVLGRSRRHAALIALADCAGQHPDWATQLDRLIVDPLAADLDEARRTADREAAATRAEFFTLVRSE